MVLRGNKYAAMIVCLGAYGAAFILCYWLYPVIRHLDPLLSAALLDLVATVAIFAVSMLFNNSSFYDPYWSVAPVPIVIFWSLGSLPGHANPVRQILIISLITLWAVRLTWNWARRWQGFSDEDWRYAGFRKQFGKAYWLISFAGIHFFPTVIVFAGLLPVYAALTSAPGPIGIIDVIAGMVAIHAIVLETAADEQLRRFTAANKVPGSFLRSGLWKYSRHPNYLGEVTFWIGLFLFSLACSEFRWWYLAGPVSMVLLFRFISIPMIEKRMRESKYGYDEYAGATSSLLLWPPQRRR
jgi:steroid 5-alpha reductase family enzyme